MCQTTGCLTVAKVVVFKFWRKLRLLAYTRLSPRVGDDAFRGGADGMVRLWRSSVLDSTRLVQQLECIESFSIRSSTFHHLRFPTDSACCHRSTRLSPRRTLFKSRRGLASSSCSAFLLPSSSLSDSLREHTLRTVPATLSAAFLYCATLCIPSAKQSMVGPSVDCMELSRWDTSSNVSALLLREASIADSA